MCHGYAGSNQRGGVCMDAGGMGLQLGRENVLHNNVAMWTAIKGKVEHIVVYPAPRRTPNRATRGQEPTGVI